MAVAFSTLNFRSKGESVENLEPTAVSTLPLSGGSGDQFYGGNGESISGDRSWRQRVSEKGSGRYGGTICPGRGSKNEQVVC
jgi:hypothetical protein